MAYRALAQPLGGFDMALLHEARADRRLIGRRCPVHIEHGLVRAQVRRRIAMAVQAPAHGERRRLAHQFHGLDFAVAGRAAHTLGHVYGMIEIGIGRQVMDAVPLKRSLIGKAPAHGRKHRRVGPFLRMAVHASLGRCNAGEGCLLDGGVAVTAIDPEAADMVLMAEGNRLLAGHVLRRCVGRAPKCVSKPHGQDRRRADRGENDAGDRIRSWMKYLNHPARAAFRPSPFASSGIKAGPSSYYPQEFSCCISQKSLLVRLNNSIVMQYYSHLTCKMGCSSSLVAMKVQCRPPADSARSSPVVRTMDEWSPANPPDTTGSAPARRSRLDAGETSDAGERSIAAVERGRSVSDPGDEPVTVRIILRAERRAIPGRDDKGRQGRSRHAGLRGRSPDAAAERFQMRGRPTQRREAGYLAFTGSARASVRTCSDPRHGSRLVT